MELVIISCENFYKYLTPNEVNIESQGDLQGRLIAVYSYLET